MIYENSKQQNILFGWKNESKSADMMEKLERQHFE
uniref:Uncharacterized protein n=1 Tax=Rhizophora mucronata TaxID=61149 RepID=A0A2P2NDC4_RHIMU